VILLALLACAQAPVPLRGEVRDPWGRPVGGAEIEVAGLDGRWTSDAAGTFTLALSRGELARARRAPDPSMTVSAHAEGHALAAAAVAPPWAEAEAAPVTLALTLWPIPDKPGFHAVGDSAYAHLPGRRVVAVDGAVGVAHPAAGAPFAQEPPLLASDARFVFLSTTRATQLEGLGLALARTQERGTVEVPVEDVPLDVSPLGARDLYLVRPASPLAPGTYAFHAGGVLGGGGSAALDAAPQELRLAHPFVVR
jgi:hypothetical protein